MRLITAADLMNPRVLTVRHDLTVRELANVLVENESPEPRSRTARASSWASCRSPTSRRRSPRTRSEARDLEGERGDFFLSEWEDDGTSREEIEALGLTRRS